MSVPNVKVILFFVWDLPTLIKNSAVVGDLKRMDALLQQKSASSFDNILYQIIRFSVVNFVAFV